MQKEILFFLINYGETMTLGDKIKKRRCELGLTQQQLVGEHITRNMLSQVENNCALPSLQTLQILADKLKLPCGYFLSSENNILPFLKLENQSKLLSLYNQGKYEECIRISDMVYGEQNDDETAYFRCQALIKAAVVSMHAGAMKKAVSYAEKALSFSSKTNYDVGHLICIGVLVLAISKNPNAPRLEFDEEKYQSIFREITQQDLYHYLKDDLYYQYHDDTMRAHINSKHLMKQGKFEEAYKQMEEIHIIAGKSISAYVLWRLFGDMEICARNLRDFENAYRISLKRMSLTTAFQS